VEKSIFWNVIVSVIVRGGGEVPMNKFLILNGYRESALRVV